jgi:phosphoglycerate kinase
VKNGIIHDPYRIDATIGTLYHINAKGGKMILMTHVGRPKDKKTSKIEIDDATSVEPIVEYLNKKLHINIKIPEIYEESEYGLRGIETSINHLIKDLQNDEIDGIYLPNTRWYEGEEAKAEVSDRFAYQLAGLADIFVNDAFGSWQAHASTVGVTKYLPSYAGFLMQKEIENLDRIYEPKKPFVAVVAGAKFDTKIEPLYSLLQKADYLILGGVIYNAYICAKYGVSIKGISEDNLQLAKKFLDYSKKYKDKIIELPFIIESDILEENKAEKTRIIDVSKLESGQKLSYVLDVSRKSFEVEEIRDILLKAKTIFVNAVMGFTPNFNEGTIALDEIIDQNSEATKLYGGGDTMQELKRLLPGLYIMALDSPKYYIFTGGGAVLKAIQEGNPYGLLPVKALKENSNEK